MVLHTNCTGKLEPSVFVPCAGSSVWGAGCLGSFSWLWAAARWSTAAPRPPSLWPWYPGTRCPPGWTRSRRDVTLRCSQNTEQYNPWGKWAQYLRSIRQPGYELWCHPVGGSHQRLPSLYFLRHLGTEPKVWQLHLEAERQEAMDDKEKRSKCHHFSHKARWQSVFNIPFVYVRLENYNSSLHLLYVYILMLTKTVL